MIRRGLLCLVLATAVTGQAHASAAPKEDAPAEGEEGASSAAVAGTFDAMPPSDRAYPADILSRVRAKLTGEDKLPNDAPASNGHGDGH